MPDKASLAGLRIIEISSFVAAPLGGMTLGQLGADVIRLDPAGRAEDTTRWPLAPSGASHYWTGLNKGKRSITLDFRSVKGRATVAELVAKSGPDGGTMRGRSAMPSRGLVGDSNHSRSVPGRPAGTAPVPVTSVSRGRMLPARVQLCVEQDWA
jgi:hypothetical protein